MKLKQFFCIVLALSLTACAAVSSKRTERLETGIAESAEVTPLRSAKRDQSAIKETQPLESDDVDHLEPTLIKGSDVMIATPSSKGRIAVSGEVVSLHFEQAPVAEVVNAIFGDLLKIDYALVTPLKGEITLHTHGPVPQDQVLTLLESLLQANGIAMVADASGRYRIGSAEVLKGAVPLPRRTEALPIGFGSVIVPLQYIGAAEMADILRPIAPPEALLRVDVLRNLLILAGTRSQIDGWLEMVNTFDVDFLKGMSIGLFPLTHVSLLEAEEMLKSVLGQGSGSATLSQGAVPPQAGGAAVPRKAGTPAAVRAAATDPAQVSIGPLAGLIRIVPIERLNALLVVTPRVHYLEQAQTWIERIDRPVDNNAEPQLYVYPVQNGSARHLAQVLSGIFGGGVQSMSSGVAPGLRPGSAMTAGFGGSAASSKTRTTGTTTAGTASSSINAGSTGLGAQSGGQPGVTAVDAGEGVRVVADERNNVILIYGLRSDYNKIEAALKRLDISPIQVLIQASIIEVTLTDDLQYGLQWAFRDKHGGLSGSGMLSVKDGSIPERVSGFFYSLKDADGAVRALLNMLAEKSLVKVISSPSLMVLDNHTAVINVGDEQPIKTGDTTSDSGLITSSKIEYKETGVALTVTPSVNAGDIVTMEINQSVTDVGEVDTATQQRAFMKRQIESKVAVRSGETLVLGGLIRNNATTSRAGLPILHDLPVVGDMFGSTTDKDKRTELLVILTPRVVRSDQDMRDVGAEMRLRMQGLRKQDELRRALENAVLRPPGTAQDEHLLSQPAGLLNESAPKTKRANESVK